MRSKKKENVEGLFYVVVVVDGDYVFFFHVHDEAQRGSPQTDHIANGSRPLVCIPLLRLQPQDKSP